MAQEEKLLPWELIEEILSRVPPEFLIRFRTVCKRWNALFDDKTFIKNHKAAYRFILAAGSKMYSVSIDPKIEVCELTLDIPSLESKFPKRLIDCNGLLLYEMDALDDKGAVVFNPCLKQTRWIEPEDNKPTMDFHGIGYEYNNRTLLEESGYNYKTLVSYSKYSNPVDYNKTWLYIHDFTSGEWKDLGSSFDCDNPQEKTTLHTSSCLSLNGILYWIASFDMAADRLYHLCNFDFSSEKFSKFCDLPCGVNHLYDVLLFKLFRGDRFSLLKQSYETKKTEVWVTKNKIVYEDGDDVVWMNFMTLSSPDLPGLVHTHYYSEPSYFINDKRLVVCSCDETGRAWIYIMVENKLITKIQIDSVVDRWPLNCSYIPSLIPVPGGKREEADLEPKKR